MYIVVIDEGARWYVVGDCMSRGETHLYLTAEARRARRFTTREAAEGRLERVREMGYDARIEERGD
jgi:hypothetical protein